jgi:hypothetical protein
MKEFSFFEALQPYETTFHPANLGGIFRIFALLNSFSLFSRRRYSKTPRRRTFFDKEEKIITYFLFNMANFDYIYEKHVRLKSILYIDGILFGDHSPKTD